MAITTTVPAVASPTATTASSSASPSPSPNSGVALPSVATLRDALLTAAELGPTFTTAPDSGDPNHSASGCKPLADLLNEPPASTNQVTANYQRSAIGPFVSLELTTGTPPALQAGYDSVKAAFSSCQTVTLTIGGTTTTFTLTPMQAGGANTVADRMDGSVKGVQMTGYIMLDLLPSAILTFDQMQVDSGSSQLAFALHSKALTKAQQKLGG
ncbi:hypothetical protein [Kitasatospora sp. GP30]|uniref:hypothetical protein n=1 Tax=Kitasatospora sp. GP30 TaxID=3035084 RepID=UPI000C6FFEC9|nr:hypothetical protein [Kitasatospora sp. GP30]